MAKKVKRKPRNEIKEKPDMTIPVPIDLLGSENDPCFGKLWDPRADECQRCGDCEICAIFMGQNNNIKRLLVEKEGNFKDLEETKISSGLKPAVVKKSIRKRIRTMVKEAGKVGLDKQVIINDIFGSYSKDGFDQMKIKKLLTRTIEKSDHLSLTKNKVIWNTKSQA